MRAPQPVRPGGRSIAAIGRKEDTSAVRARACARQQARFAREAVATAPCPEGPWPWVDGASRIYGPKQGLRCMHRLRCRPFFARRAHAESSPRRTHARMARTHLPRAAPRRRRRGLLSAPLPPHAARSVRPRGFLGSLGIRPRAPCLIVGTTVGLRSVLHQRTFFRPTPTPLKVLKVLKVFLKVS